MAEKRLFKEYKQLKKSHPNYSNHQILNLAPIDPETSIFEWLATIAKKSKSDSPYYYNGQWELEIEVPSQYPISPPKIQVSSRTPIFHPNINIDTGEICLDILKTDSWSPAWNLEHLVVAILMLLDDPEPDSPLNIDLANLFRDDKIGFESFVQFSMWKHSTLYEGERTTEGIKIGEPSDLVENSVLIKDVGRQITQEFIDKVDEIRHSKENSETSIEHDADYNSAKKHIAENVSRQVNELVSKSVSPVNEETVDSVDTAVGNEAEKDRFIREVNSKVEQLTQAQNTSPDGSIYQSTSIKSGSSDRTRKRDKIKGLLKREHHGK